jgi:predicted TIM-barrel fold metal-dependent hydrolase
MTRRFGLISVDDHVQEHPHVWLDRLSAARWGDRIPHIDERSGPGRWLIDGVPIPMAGVATVGVLSSDQQELAQRWGDVPASAYVPADRLRAMDSDGVDYSVLYPTVAGVGGENLGRITDPELELACVQAYNDWLVEEWVGASDRFVPQCLVPLYPIDAAVKELERAVGKGHRGLVYPSVPMELRSVPHINDAEYDALWSACESLGVPICFHAGSSSSIQVPPAPEMSPRISAAFASIARSASTVSVVVNLLVSRILLRHPNLRVVFAESSLGWGAYQLEFADQQAREDGLQLEGYDLTPSQMFKRQCYLTGWYGQAGIQTREFIGTSNIMWSTNFPLATSTWPETHVQIERSFAGVPTAERERMLWENAAQLYKL